MATKKSTAKRTTTAGGFEAGVKLAMGRAIGWKEEPEETGTIVSVARVSFSGGRYDDGDKARVTFMSPDGEERIRMLPGSKVETLAAYTGSMMRIVATNGGTKNAEYDYTLDKRATKLATLPTIPHEEVDLTKSKKGRASKARESLRPKAGRTAKKGAAKK